MIYESIKIFDPDCKILLELDRASYFINRVRNHSVLHVGCCDYPITIDRLESNNLLHTKLMNVSSYIVGIDVSAEGINILKNKGIDNVIFMDAENITLEDKFDFIIAGDVLEHMSNPGFFLKKVDSLLGPKGKLIVAVPNAYSFNIIKYLTNKIEPTHKDHTFFFSVKSLSQLCSRYDLLPTKLIFTVQPKGQYEKPLYITIRNFLVNRYKTIAPSIIMEFTPKRYVDILKYLEWK